MLEYSELNMWDMSWKNGDTKVLMFIFSKFRNKCVHNSLDILIFGLYCYIYITIGQMDVAWVVGRNECYSPHPGSTLVSDMLLLWSPL